MEVKKKIILEELKKTAKTLGTDRFSRDDFYRHSSVPISQRDIESNFGSFAKAMEAANLKPVKWAKVSDEELFKAYDHVYKTLGYYPLGHPGQEELSRLTSISGHTFRKRFKGLKNFLFEYKNWLLEKNVKTQQQTVSAKANVYKKPKIQLGETEYFDNKQRYSGKAAENLVVAELLFRGFNAQILQVDEGIDVFATNIKKNELYLIQVKHTYYDNITKSRPVSITVSSFEKNKKSNVYYILVLERDIDKRDFLILPFIKVDELIENGSISKNENSTKMLITVVHNGEDDALIGKTDVSRYLNAWDVLL